MTAAVCLFLVVLAFAAFAPALGNGFVNYDDSEYVYENPHITAGLTGPGIAWAFTHAHASNWHPLSTISHMLDCQLYGLQPWGHHLTNLLLHAAAALLLFLALRCLTNSFWPAALVAAIFAVHPLRVESVAWVSERKDVLSGFFFMAALWAYARYARCPGRRTREYLGLVVLFTIGLLCKPTLVTFPFVLLLLDYWPLRRFEREPIMQIVLEKTPLFLLSIAASVATLLAQEKVIQANLRLSLLARASNALISYVAYLGEMFYPARLTVSHPYPLGHTPLLAAGLSLLLLAAISVLFFLLRRTHPYLLVGWLWYLGMLVPMIGLVQVGAEARADRYTYLSQIGLYLLIVWTARSICRSRVRREVIVAAALLVVFGLAARSYAQTFYWRDTETLWRHALDQSSFDYIACDNLGYALLQKGEVDEAIEQYEKALALKPDYADAHDNLGNALLLKNRTDEAIAHYQKALEIEPDYAEVHNNLGNVRLKRGEVDEAIANYEKALAIRPGYAEVQSNLGSALIVKGEWERALACFRKALNDGPNYATIHNKMGITLAASGKPVEALKEFEEAVELDPGYAEAHFNLGYVLAHSGRRGEGVAHLRTAVRLRPDYEDPKRELQELGASR